MQIEETLPDGLRSSSPILLPPNAGARGRALRLTRFRVQRAAFAGRLGMTWLLAFLFADYRLDTAASIKAATLIAIVWFTALQMTAPATRLTMPLLGVTGRTALGSAAGVVALLASAPWISMDVAGVAGVCLILFVATTWWEALVARSPAARKRVLVVGSADGGAEIVEELAHLEGCPFDVIGFIDDDRHSERIAGLPRFGGLEDLGWVLDVQRPDLVVLAVSRNRPEAFTSLMRNAGAGFDVLGLAEFHEQAFGRVPVQHLTPAWFMSVLHFYRREYTRHSKRVFDIVVSCLGLLLTAPLFPLVYFLVKRTPGPALFRQTRLGEGGKHFTMIKFRTMRQDAEEAGQAMWAGEHDPRITGVGRFLRRARLDELPQLWNVLRGDMSIVGPRPERPEFLEYLHQTVPFWTRRHLVKPGITGWAQLRRGYTSDADGTAEKLSYDFWYLRHRSLLVDLAICAKTFTVLFSGSGSR